MSKHILLLLQAVLLLANDKILADAYKDHVLVGDQVESDTLKDIDDVLYGSLVSEHVSLPTYSTCIFLLDVKQVDPVDHARYHEVLLHEELIVDLVLCADQQLYLIDFIDE